MISKSNSISEIAAALGNVQAKLSGAKKSGVNPHFKIKYADLEDAWDAIRDLMAENGLSVAQGCCVTEDGKQMLSTLLMHAASGQWIEGVQMLLCKDMADPQKMGSAITYARRYGLKAMVGLYDTDDDGECASRPHQPHGGVGVDHGILKAEVVDNYLSRISSCEDVNVLRGICETGLKEAAAASDREAAARIRQAGIDRAAAIKPAEATE